MLIIIGVIVSSTAHKMNIFIGQSASPSFLDLWSRCGKGLGEMMFWSRSKRYQEDGLTRTHSWHGSLGRWCWDRRADLARRRLGTGADSQTGQIRVSPGLYHYSFLPIRPLGTVDRVARWLEILRRPRPLAARSGLHHGLLRLGSQGRQIPHVPIAPLTGTSYSNFDPDHHFYLGRQLLFRHHVLADSGVQRLRPRCHPGWYPRPSNRL